MPTNQQRREAAKRKLERQLVRRAERAKKRRIWAVAGTILAVVLVAVLVVVIVKLNSSENNTANPATTSARPSDQVNIPTALAPVPKRPTALPATVDCDYPADKQSVKPVKSPEQTKGISSQGTVNVKLGTDQGDIPLVLDRALAPCTVNSFASLVKQQYFDGTTCHRLSVEGLQMLQCGDPQGSGMGGPGYKFNDETFPEIKYGRGILAMANAGANTNGSQFFMVFGDAQLPPNYTVFGTISEAGLQVVDKIAKGGTDHSESETAGKPNIKPTITKATVS